MAEKTVAIMQPYFFPYAGYFRLLAAVDEFVIYDSVQFPKGGRVHRTEVPGPTGATEWLTLPLARHSHRVLIRDLAFSRHARHLLDERLARLRWIESARGPAAARVKRFLYAPLESPVIDFLEQGLRLVADLLSLDVSFSRSSAHEVSPSLAGQSRVIAVAAAVGATTYINPPGGRSLYRVADFERAGVELRFLAPYDGRFFHLLPALLEMNPDAIRADVLATTASST